jgi:hypothetical protein
LCLLLCATTIKHINITVNKQDDSFTSTIMTSFCGHESVFCVGKELEKSAEAFTFDVISH